jgi:F-type H+-transporting ATPase subunit epsilon
VADPKQLHDGSGGARGLSSELRVHMVTPRGRIAHKTTDAVTAPGELGEFEVLPGHVPMLAELHPGVLTLGEHDAEVFAVGRGYLRVDADGEMEIMVEEAIAAESIDQAAVEDELDKLAGELEDWREPENAAWKTLKGRHDWAEARVAATRALKH